MRTYPIATLLVIVFCGSVVLTTIGALSAVSGEDSATLEQVGLLSGHVASLFATSFVWSKYPALPGLLCLVDGMSIILTLPLIMAAVYLTRAGRRWVFPVRIGVLLAVALLLYVAGAIALHDNSNPAVFRTWLRIMLLGPLYTLAACSLLCVAEVRQRLRCPAG